MTTMITIGQNPTTRERRNERYKISDGIAQIAGAVIGGGMDMINSNQDRQFNKGQAREADARALENSKQLALFNKEQQLDLWNKTNYEAQMEHLKAAGLNPGLMYGMSGGGGATANLATGGGGQGTASRHQTPSMAGMGMQLGQAMMNAAQIDNIKADTEKKKVEAENLAGTDRENKIADTEGKGLDNQMKGIELAIKTSTKEEAERRIIAEAEKLTQEATQAGIRTDIGKATVNDEIKIIKERAIAGVLENELTRVNTNKSEAEIRKISEEISTLINNDVYGWSKLNFEEKKLKIETELRNKGLNIATAAVAVGAIDKIGGFISKQ